MVSCSTSTDFCDDGVMLSSRWLFLGLLMAAVLLGALPAAGAAPAPIAHSSASCADHPNQAAAQRAADTRDGDGDGIYCESLPCPCAAGSSPGDEGSSREGPEPRRSCRRLRRRSVLVRLDDERYPLTTDHILDAIRTGERRLLHIDRRHADEHRAEATRGIPTRRGYDRDEYPPAFSREGGRGADVRYVRSSDNRGAGASLGNQLRGYCNGQAFRIRVI